jgi:hypothetical protein
MSAVGCRLSVVSCRLLVLGCGLLFLTVGCSTVVVSGTLVGWPMLTVDCRALRLVVVVCSWLSAVGFRC